MRVDGEVPVFCQRELHTRRFLGAPVEAMQWIPSTYPTAMIVVENL
jgi:hypothetical protein